MRELLGTTFRQAMCGAAFEIDCKFRHSLGVMKSGYWKQLLFLGSTFLSCMLGHRRGMRCTSLFGVLVEEPELSEAEAETILGNIFPARAVAMAVAVLCAWGFLCCTGF